MRHHPRKPHNGDSRACPAGRDAWMVRTEAVTFPAWEEGNDSFRLQVIISRDRRLSVLMHRADAGDVGASASAAGRGSSGARWSSAHLNRDDLFAVLFIIKTRIILLKRPWPRRDKARRKEASDWGGSAVRLAGLQRLQVG